MIPFNLDSQGSSLTGSTPFTVSVIGIGGSGTNVIDKMALENLPGADLISMNCDARSLQSSMAGTKLQLGKSLTQGLGCGGDPELGAEAAVASQAEIVRLLAGRSMVFLCAGLGGGTGSGAAPVVARLAREAGAFVVVFATLPFAFEGRRRSNQSMLALQELKKYANALVTFENDRMGELVVPKKGVQEAFELADKIIGQSVRAVTGLVTQPGLIRIGMDDLITALRHTDSRCLFGYGQAKGENRAVEALGQALKSPLLDRGQMLSGARNVLVHICGGSSLTLFEIETLMRELGKQVHEDAQILFGAANDPTLNENLSVTILTSLNKAASVVESPGIVSSAPAVAARMEAAAEAQPPIAASVSDGVAATQDSQKLAETALTATPAEAPATPSAVTDEELFPEIVAIPQPASFPEAPAAISEPETSSGPLVTSQENEEEDPLLLDSFDEPMLAAVESAPVTALAMDHSEEEISSQDSDFNEEETPVATPVTEAPILEEKEPDPPSEPETIPGRVIRIERQPAAQPRQKIPAPRHGRVEPVRPIPVPQQPAPPAKRFGLSEIIKSKPAASTPAPAPVPVPQVEYEAEEETVSPLVSQPQYVAPVTIPRRAPDYERVTPIRPIPAGRSITPASPFTPARSNTGAASGTAPVSSPVTSVAQSHAAGAPDKVHAQPSTAAAPSYPSSRPAPTQQQTFDERLQPASSGSRFERVKPTVEEGEDLDVPTFLRRKR